MITSSDFRKIFLDLDSDPHTFFERFGSFNPLECVQYPIWNSFNKQNRGTTGIGDSRDFKS
ncbi:hypothetical protein PVOR_19439 [Paenibacillus vortex V453]|uniref:Uncharacterized protein n=1 Tax=Paenibacillus vortex V453 TaxID=715225 RepID=A0A2R9SSH1_9BACL|nr:hypothetical protein [Paenibacillus vortex]EFU40306.1 hypothetical protein PVOR_19439 [Paenibacillus vortex V453]